MSNNNTATTTTTSTTTYRDFDSSRTNPNNSSRELCRYFAQGNCRYGGSCFYSHNLSSSNPRPTDNQPDTASSSLPLPSNVCKYFLVGRCMFGDNCFNRHVAAPPPSQPAVDSSQEDVHQQLNSSSSNNSNNTSKSSSNETSSCDHTQLVKRFTAANKPKLITASLTNGEAVGSNQNNNNSDEQPEEHQASGVVTADSSYTPASYYEALTGKKLNYDELNDLDYNMFDENYIDYLKRRKQMSDEQENTRASMAAAAASSGSSSMLCPYFEKQLMCPFEQCGCEYVHGDVCDLCQTACLNPFDEKQRDEHRKECMKYIEKDMEEAFAVQCSSQKLCGICMEIVWEKENTTDRRFGILENCNHIFCLNCIRKWRSSKSYENKIVKACPECRVKSDYVTPSKFWFENEDDKKKIIQEYKSKLGKTACKYFKQGEGSCPFGNKCFYLHQYKDGRLANLPEPTRRRRFNRDGNMESYSNIVRIDFNFSDDEDDDEFDLFEFFRQNLLWDTDTESDFSDLFELSSEFLNLI